MKAPHAMPSSCYNVAMHSSVGLNIHVSASCTLLLAQAGVGSNMTVATDRPCSSFALVRYGTATHALDTDQRRVPLTPRPLNPAAASPASPVVTADSAAASGGRRLTQQRDYNTAGGGAGLSQGYLPDGSIVQIPAVQAPWCRTQRRLGLRASSGPPASLLLPWRPRLPLCWRQHRRHLLLSSHATLGRPQSSHRRP